MAFIEISNPTKWNEIVEDYINTKHQPQEKYENDKCAKFCEIWSTLKIRLNKGQSSAGGEPASTPWAN